MAEEGQDLLDAGRVRACAEAVADGRPFDWGAVEAGGTDPDERELCSKLRAVARIGDLFGTAGAGVGMRPRARRVLTPGTVWGPLHIIEHVGRGNFGDVYRASDPTLDRDVALKLLLHRESDDSLVEHVVEEGRLMARVRHPNVVTIHGAQRVEGITGLWMEFIDGRTLAGELADRGPFNADELVEVGLALAGALAAVHDAGLLHRDVKAQNIMRDRGGRIVLGDFGTGCDLDEIEDDPSALEGTPAYLAPEIFTGAPASRGSDIYSLGTLLFHLATRRYPVEGRSLRALRDAHAIGDRLSLAVLRPDLPRSLTTAIGTALAEDPSRRFGGAAEMARVLQRALPRASRGRLVTAAMAVVLGSSVIGAVLLTRSNEPAVPFDHRDWLLVAAFDNRTGNAELDGLIEHALEAELAESKVVNLMPRVRVDDTLELMRRERGTRVDGVLGREVAIRDERVRAVVAGTLDRVGTSYSVNLHLLRPDDGAVVARVGDRATSEDELMAAIRRVALEIRSRLGEALAAIPAAQEKNARVTTSSLRAWRLYTAARFTAGYHWSYERRLDRQFSNKAARAEVLLREALRHDPDFVAARVLLGVAQAGQPGWQRDLISAEFDRAMESARRGTEHDRYLAAAAYHAWHADRVRLHSDEVRADHRRRHLAACEGLLQVRPNDVWALACVIHVALDTESAPAIQLAERWIALRPAAPEAYLSAARASLVSGNYEAAAAFARRATGLEMTGQNADLLAQASLLTGFVAWLQDRPQELLASIESALARVADRPRDIQLPFWWYAGYANLTLGRLREAEALFAKLDDERARRGQIWVDMEWRDPIRLRKTIGSGRIDARGTRPISSPSELLEAGLFAEARQAVTTVHPSVTQHSRVRGELAVVGQEPDLAIDLLEAVLPRERVSVTRMRIARYLARAWAAKGNHERAITVLETASREPRFRLLGASMMGFTWLAVSDQLSQLYRQNGRFADADEVDLQLATLLALADDDHPIKRRLRREGTIPPER